MVGAKKTSFHSQPNNLFQPRDHFKFRGQIKRDGRFSLFCEMPVSMLDILRLVTFKKFSKDEIDFTCHTPTIAFAIKIRRMTKGSTKAVIDSSSSSKKANT
jgi:hypothetical protein